MNDLSPASFPTASPAAVDMPLSIAAGQKGREAVDPVEAQWIAEYGPDFREKLGFAPKGSQPYAETDDGAFYDFFGPVPFDGAADLTALEAARARVTEGMGNG